MSEKKYYPVKIGMIADHSPLIIMKELASICDIHKSMISRFVRLGLIDPLDMGQSEDAWVFPGETISIVQKILRLRNDLGINYQGIGVVLELLSRIEELEARIREIEMNDS